MQNDQKTGDHTSIMKPTLILILILLFAQTTLASDLTIVITGVEINQGRLYVRLYDTPKEFPGGKRKAGQIIDSDAQALKVIFTDLPHGKYAVSIFQDKNGNEKLDANFIGIPKENYGISGKPSFGKPKFKKAAIIVDSHNHQIEIQMK